MGFEVFIDNKSVRAGKLDEEFDYLPDKEIKDPDQSKPNDWVDEKKIADPDDEKPEGYDDIPMELPDPDASKPDDWDEDDGQPRLQGEVGTSYDLEPGVRVRRQHVRRV